MRVAQLDVDAAVTGRPIDLTVEGSGDLAGPETGAAHLAITTLARAAPDRQVQDHYTVEASMDASHLHATLDVSEAPKGLISSFVQLPDLGAVTINASVDGPLSALATNAAIAAGPLRANLNGNVDTVGDYFRGYFGVGHDGAQYAGVAMQESSHGVVGMYCVPRPRLNGGSSLIVIGIRVAHADHETGGDCEFDQFKSAGKLRSKR